MNWKIRYASERITFQEQPEGARSLTTRENVDKLVNKKCDCPELHPELGDYQDTVKWHLRAADAHSGMNVSPNLTLDQQIADGTSAPIPSNMNGAHITAHWNRAKQLGWDGKTYWQEML